MAVIIPYIRGANDTIARILQPYNIRVAHKPITTLRQLLTNVRLIDEIKQNQLRKNDWKTDNLTNNRQRFNCDKRGIKTHQLH